jgi:hypothetical protein
MCWTGRMLGASRWNGVRKIELFFRALKQSLRVKTFVGTSAQALKTQLWTALIAILLVKYLKLKSAFGWSLSNLVALLTPATVCLPRSVDLDRQSFPASADTGCVARTVGLAACLSG